MSASMHIDLQPPNKAPMGVKVFPPLGGRLKDSFLQSQPNEVLAHDKGFRVLESTSNSTYKFFTHEEGKLTARTTTRSTKYTSSRRNRPKCSSSLSVDNSLMWEITERVDTYSLRSLKKPENINLEYFASQIELGGQCFTEISKIMNMAYPDIVSVMGNFNDSLFKIFQNFIEFHKTSVEALKSSLSFAETKNEKIKNEYASLEKKFKNLERVRGVDELTIEAEVNKMFPGDPEEIQNFKDRVGELKKLRPGGVTELLQDIINRMNLERKMPEETDMDFGEFSTDKIVDGIKYNYEVIVTSTIKSIKKAFRNSFAKISTGVQTSASYIDPKKFEEMAKQLDKALLSSQSNAVQLEKCKEELKVAIPRLEQLENERTIVKNENQSLKQELEYRNKEIQRLRSDIESRKVETSTIQRQSTIREKEIENIERVKTKLETENIELKTVIKRFEQQINAPVSVFPIRRKVEELPPEPPTQSKKSNLDEITASGLTVREKLEREYMLNKRLVKSPIPPDSTSPTTKRLNLTDLQKNSALINNFARNEFENSEKAQKKKRFSDISMDDTPRIEERSHGELEDDDSDTDQEIKSPNRTRGNNTHSTESRNRLAETVEKIKVTIKRSEVDSGMPESAKSSKPQKNSHEIKRKHTKIKTGTKAKETNNEGKGKQGVNKKGSTHDKSQTNKVIVVSRNLDRLEEGLLGNDIFADKCCGNDIFAVISIGVQVNNGLPEPDEPEIDKGKFIHAFNPNNIYGLRGDVYYKNTVFQAQPRIPELMLPYQQSFVGENKR